MKPIPPSLSLRVWGVLILGPQLSTIGKPLYLYFPQGPPFFHGWLALLAQRKTSQYQSQSPCGVTLVGGSRREGR